MSTSPTAATCARCSTPLNGWSDACAHCGYVAGVSPSHNGTPPQAPGSVVPAMSASPMPAHYPQQVVHVVPAKSPGIAVLLSFLWLGAGHLYVGSTAVGIGLIVLDFFLVLLSFIPLVWIVTFPIWLIAFIAAAVHASNGAKAFNRRNGIVVH